VVSSSLCHFPPLFKGIMKEKLREMPVESYFTADNGIDFMKEKENTL